VTRAAAGATRSRGFASWTWLGLFLASWVAPLAFDATFGLTYFTSLLFWLVPTVMLLPRFLHDTDPGGRRRTAIRIAILQILALGIVLDFALLSMRALAIGVALEALGLYLKHRWEATLALPRGWWATSRAG
jgi:hypothetical protein